ncbi:uroporphyrinogen-III C-methyltransferase [Alteribacillus sp. HJP-4]|uniref:uroporphyrinogen-III C-methyltransferase n=1 Tax=Alteribacillus sp. HJP-4 TaxID=2775394 RepID=UPI0035CD1539
MNQSYGKVYLVGAGPGSPDLLTIRGAECLQKADVVLYDRLAHPALLFHIPAHAKLIYCGKKPCAHTLRQEDIQNEMYIHAKRGKTVVRLKGGDPAVFGRVAEELTELAVRGIAYEIVPGITAGSAAASYAGISLTHREYAHGYQVLTGHGKNPDEDRPAKWLQLAETTNTLIWYMGMKRLSHIASQLMLYGKDPHENVLVIEWATHRHQRTISGTLENIAEKVDDAAIKNPSIIIIGKVTRQHEALQWFHSSSVGGVLTFIQNDDERQAFEELKTSDMEVYISTHFTKDASSFNNSMEITKRLAEEKFIKHIVIPPTSEGMKLKENLSELGNAEDISFWCTAESSEATSISAITPLHTLNKDSKKWLGQFYDKEHLDEKATV